MNTAQRFEREFNLIEKDDRGFCNGRLLRGFIERCEYQATREEYPYGTDSCDCTRVYVFADGSALHVANPNQAFYPAFVGGGSSLLNYARAA